MFSKPTALLCPEDTTTLTSRISPGWEITECFLVFPFSELLGSRDTGTHVLTCPRFRAHTSSFPPIPPPSLSSVQVRVLLSVSPSYPQLLLLSCVSLISVSSSVRAVS